jgi:signal transduction histidine kinase
MRVQDEEHRRFARELHDGLGQLLVGAKMMTDGLVPTRPDEAQVAELSAVLGDAISQIRTISYLFHPPLLDEVGFVSAAQWLVDRYAQRTNLNVSLDIASFQERLPPSAELTLYRVLQETLNNIHRHSNSQKADVAVRIDSEWVTLDVRDYGRGIRSETLAALRSNGEQAGVGLTGMKERVKEQGGHFGILSDETGTQVIVRLPIRANLESSNSMPAESALNIG